MTMNRIGRVALGAWRHRARWVAGWALGVLLSGIPAPAGAQLVLWYSQPAETTERMPANGWSNTRGWVEALPVGNGRLGAMVYGGTAAERLQLNEDSVWSGKPQDADNPDALAHLPEIRRLLFEGKYAEAQKLTYAKLACRGPGTCGGAAADCDFGCYQTLGDLDLAFEGLGPVSEYRRELDLDTAVARVSFVAGGVRHVREVFASKPGEALVMRLGADQQGKLRFTAGLSRPGGVVAAGDGSGDLILSGRVAKDHGVRYLARLRALPEGGTVKVDGNRLRIEGANAVTLILTAGTDYKGRDPEGSTERQLAAAARKPYAQLRSEHVAEHQRWFHRVRLDLGGAGTEAARRPTPERLEAFAKGGSDPHLAALYFQYGRYLLLSSSRPGDLAANLQGLWAEGIQTPWNCDYHININVQMNYWPAEVANLAECHLPLFDLIESLREPGRKTAKVHYGAGGWVCHTVVNPWGYTSPGEHPSWGQFPAGAGWLCQHLWEHYDFGRDLEFLRRSYPVLREAAQFYLDFMVVEPRKGWLVTAPSNSPENNFRTADGQTAAVCYAPTMDVQIIRELFTHCMEASRLLDTDPGFRATLAAAVEKLPPHQVGRRGQLQEWIEDFEETEPKHRHVSHLYGLHPGRQITRRGTPDLAKAAQVSLEGRGDDGTGWSLAWKLNFWARLGDGDRAHRLLRNLLRPVRSSGVNMTGGGGTFPNLFDAHPPFQIDGNLGGCAGIAEMLVQSHAGELELLPALPRDWPSGRVTGLRARGGYTVEILWGNRTLQRAVLRASQDGPARIRAGAGAIVGVGSTEGAVPLRRPSEGVIEFDARKGGVYELVAGPATMP